MYRIDFTSCESYYIPPFEDIRIMDPLEFYLFQQAYGVTVEMTFEELNEWFNNDFKNKCQSLISKAQCKHIIENNVKVALTKYNFDFHFTHQDSDMIFQTRNAIDGWIVGFTFTEQDGALFGEGTIKFHSSDAVVIVNDSIAAKDWAAFYVNQP
jgi:hypothetical protein